MKDLIKEYKESLKSIRQAKEETKIKSDREHLASMERDLMNAIQWMRTGWEPGNRRGVERLASYQREKPVDPIHL